MLVHIPPRLRRRNGKVHYERLGLIRVSISNLNPDRLTLSAETRMDDYVATHQMSYTERAPDARSPPTQSVTLHPIQRRRQRKGMNYPGFMRIRLQDDSMHVGQQPPYFFDLF
jgi:hypothetical protein